MVILSRLHFITDWNLHTFGVRIVTGLTGGVARRLAPPRLFSFEPFGLKNMSGYAVVARMAAV